MQAVVDVGGPDCGCKQQQLEGECVGGYKKEGPEVGYGLQDAVNGVEGQPGEWGQRVLLVVGVVDVVQLPAPISEYVQWHKDGGSREVSILSQLGRVIKSEYRCVVTTVHDFKTKK